MKHPKKGFLWLCSLLVLAGFSAQAQIPQGLPSRAQRIHAFVKSDLEETTVHWDELEQDLLYWRAGHQSLESLQAQYPQFTSQQLQRLQAALVVKP